MGKRKAWIDQARGLSIFLVVYGHNFPLYEPYIYSFHVPLFFFIAGLFHPAKTDRAVITRRAKMILIPYFVWSTLLFVFWWLVGRNYGDSTEMNLSVTKNFLGIFYAQGGSDYMNWGIPMWFLPCVFVLFLLYAALQRINNPMARYFGWSVLVLTGFAWPVFGGGHLPWSLDVAMVALFFYGVGKWVKNLLFDLQGLKLWAIALLLLGVHVLTFYLNDGKVDMYRSLYGTPWWFLISGLTGSAAYVLLFKALPKIKALSYIGQHTIVILATHLRMATIVKFVLMMVLGITAFNFTEGQKLLLSVVQVVLIIPVIWAVNRWLPILDGKIKRS